MSTSIASPSDSVRRLSTPPLADADSAHGNVTHNDKNHHHSPPALSSSMTPPPTTQATRFYSPEKTSTFKTTDIAASSPATVKANSSNMLPNTDKIATAGIEELRSMAQDLVGALAEARMSAAHFKLQHTLLAMETQEAAQRAEVEQQMTRREIEVLHAAEQRYRVAASTPRPSTQPSPNLQIVNLTKTCKNLEDEKDELEDRFNEIKKLLDLEKDRAELLAEENVLLKKRIRENREHFTKLKDSPMYATPRQAFTTPLRKTYSRFAEETPAHEPFAALLYADQMLSQETASVPSTPVPTKSYTGRVKQGHVRGAHSLSSLHLTPVRRPLTSDGFPDARVLASAPASQVVNESDGRDRCDRDSTISISDVEDTNSNDLAQSQASSLAADMLRKNPASQESIRQSQEAERSSNLLQTKLFGNVKKASMPKQKGKRFADASSDDRPRGKKTKTNNSVGLGVGLESWTQAAS